MREIRTSGLMSGERKRSDAHRAQATAPLLDSTPIRSFGFWSELGITPKAASVVIMTHIDGRGLLGKRYRSMPLKSEGLHHSPVML